MMRRLLSRLSAYIVYHSFIYFSRHVSFTDFQRIWNEAYQAHVEAEWKRLRQLELVTNSMSTRSMLEGQGGEVGQMQKGLPLPLISRRLDSEGGQVGKQPL